MDDLPETLTLQGSRWKTIWLLLGEIIFVAGGIWMIIDEGSVMSWITTLMFGACGLVFVYQMFNPETMTLGPDGFELTLLHHRHIYRWNEISNFDSFAMKRHIFFTSKSVWFSRVHGDRIDGKPYGNVVLDSAHNLPDTYGMEAEGLADLMNAFRARALDIQTA